MTGSTSKKIVRLTISPLSKGPICLWGKVKPYVTDGKSEIDLYVPVLVVG